MTLLVFEKPGCALCDEAHELLENVSSRFVFSVERRNIFEDEATFARYRYRVPVVVLDGRELVELRFSQTQLEAALTAAGVQTK
jgi:glutaredoxin